MTRLHSVGVASSEASRVLRASGFTLSWVERADEAELKALGAGLQAAISDEALAEAVADCDKVAGDDEALYLAALRRLRNREQALIAWRAIAGHDAVPETLARTSTLAEACIQGALARALRLCSERHGEPCDEAGKPVPCIILGMGKLGGRELNFSSDVDLMLFYGAPGCCDGSKARANEQYFGEVAQRLTRYLAEKTADGFCHRVDWALRPFGSAGPAAMHFAAAEDYYQSHGREWERYAMVKARVIAGDTKAGARFMRMLQPFIYRRYLDYTAIESLRELKQRIADDLARRRGQDNIKLGRGGIRDLEFVVQAFQLIRGGQEEALRHRSFRNALSAISEAGHLPAEQCSSLDAAYLLLRAVENALQMRQDGQTHSLPEAPEEREAVALALDRDWQVLITELAACRETVVSAFDDLFSGPEVQRGGEGVDGAVQALWQERMTVDAAADRLAALLGDEAAGSAAKAVARIRDSNIVRDMRELSQSRLGDLLAQLVAELDELESPAKALLRALEVIERLAGRSTYVSLLRESPTARAQLAALCMASPWIAHLLAQQPMLLDQLLDSRSLFNPPDRDTMAGELQRRMEGFDEADAEGRMNMLRRYRQEIMLRVAAADRLAGLPLPKVSDRLTWLAEIIIEDTVAEVHREMAVEYGLPVNSDGSEPGFAVIGYGKLGGIEMGYGSDLDVVFLHDCDDQDEETRGGRRSVANAVWFARFAQRLVHWLSTQTPAGRAYEVDLQLRPSGSSGLLVTSFEAFAHYQREKAWTWEHQALVRARHVCGSAGIGEAFESLRREILCRSRDAAELASEIQAMRDKMRRHLDRSSDEQWDIKQGAGGLADLEFATQYLVMAHAQAHPSLVDWPDQWRQTEALAEAGVLDAAMAEGAISAYRELRALLHSRALDEGAGLVAEDTARTAREQVSALWRMCTEAAEPAAS